MDGRHSHMRGRHSHVNLTEGANRYCAVGGPVKKCNYVGLALQNPTERHTGLNQTVWGKETFNSNLEKNVEVLKNQIH